MNKESLVLVTILALAAGFVGSLIAVPTVSAIPEALRFSSVDVVGRSSTRAPLSSEQRGAGPVIELRVPAGTAIADVRASTTLRISKGIIVPSIVTMTPTPTSTPTSTPTPTITPSPTP